jgi:glycine cleavage system H protein
LRYHPGHNWARVERETATFGITWFAQDNLQEIVYFDPPALGEQVTKD